MASDLLPKSPVSSSLCNEVPHIFIPKSHLEPREFLISSAKRLLQQNRTIADKGGFWAAMVCPLMTQLRHWLCTAALFLMSVSTPVKVLALQLRFLRSSESIGHHDSEIVDDGYFDRDDAGALGVIAAGCQSADGAIVHPGAGGGFCGLIPGRTTRRRAAQDRLDACGSGGRSRSLAPAGHSGSRMVGR